MSFLTEIKSTLMYNICVDIEFIMYKIIFFQKFKKFEYYKITLNYVLKQSVGEYVKRIYNLKINNDIGTGKK